ncbi:MAG TPA: M14 family zinc carboxypeptidase [Steroidobacteraceae bacterium]|nr:M14 family zinc carboxypeptidase [Steroidobacteraceae bacterium]
MLRQLVFTVLVLRALCPLVLAQSAIAPDAAEPGSIEAISKATTEPQFLSPWVSYLPASSAVPSPLKFFGRIMGARGELLNAEQAYRYAEALAAASPRVRVFKIGRSEEGRDIMMIAIADTAGIRHLDALKARNAELADPRKLDSAAATRLIDKSRPFYYLNAGLHSDETGSTEAVLELAYRLAVSDAPMIRRIRAKMVVLINPVSNPDGRDKQVDWFYRYLKGKTDLATLPRQSPPYWGKYVFVDVNRDAIQLTQAATKAVARMFLEWHPIVIHDLHESVALLMTWNGTGPFNENVDPITYAENLAMGFHEVEAMTGLGMPGVSTWNFGEGFAHLFLESIATNHNAIGRGYETFGNSTAETLVRSLGPEDTSREWWRVLPPPRGDFLWSARDNVNYAETGILSALDYSAKNAHALLREFYLKSYHSWQNGLHEPPYGFVIPAGQGDPRRVAQMIERLQAQHIEVCVAEAPIVLNDGRFPAGSYVVRADQPYRNYAVDLLMPQHYPKDATAPYDDVSWELPANYHLQAFATADPAIRRAQLVPLTGAPRLRGAVQGAGPAYLLKDTGQESLLEARYALARFKVDIAERGFTVAGARYPQGSWIIPAQPGVGAAVGRLAAALDLDFTSAAGIPEVRRHAAPVPRLGLWVPWADTDSIGWIRYSLDRRHIPYRYVRDEDIRAGHLRSKIDILLYGRVDLALAEQIHGIPTKWGPMPFKKTKRTPSFGTPAASDDITGGIGWRGMERIQRFIDGGGLMITLSSASLLPIEGGIVRGIRRDSGGVARSAQGGGAAAAAAAQNAITRTPGAHLRATFLAPHNPIAYGYPRSTFVFRENEALYSMPMRWLRAAYCTTCLDGPVDTSHVVLVWGGPANKPFVVSGQAWGAANLIGRPAIFDMPVGKGRVVAFDFDPMHRDLNRGDQRMLWNAIINWRALLDEPAVH